MWSGSLRRIVDSFPPIRSSQLAVLRPPVRLQNFFRTLVTSNFFGDDANRIAEIRKFLQIADLLGGHITGHDVAEHRDHIDHIVGRERILGEIFARFHPGSC